MGRFIQVRADIDGEERLSVLPESALPHMPHWTAVDPSDVRENPWDFEEPEPQVTDRDATEAAGEEQTSARTTRDSPEASRTPTPKPSRRKATTGDDADTPKE